MSVPLLLLGLDLLTIAAAPLLLRPRQSDLIVVLGNTVLPNGTPAPRLQARLDTALHAWQAGLAPRILVSGGLEPSHSMEASGGPGPGSPPRDEARVRAAYLGNRGVPASALLLDPTGNNAAATARHTAALRITISSPGTSAG